MEITVKRIYLGPTYTIGNMYIDGNYVCDTLEDTVRDINKNGKFDAGEYKVYGETAIPYGRYEVRWTFSSRFKKYMPELINVPNFSGIRIHSGNTAKDTLGCILLGKNTKKGMVTESKITCNKVYPLIKDACSKGKVYIKII